MRDTEFKKFMWLIVVAYCTLFLFALATRPAYPGEVTLGSALYGSPLDANADDVLAHTEPLRDEVNGNLESYNVKDGSLTGDDFSTNADDRLSMTQVGDPNGSLNSGMYDYIRGANSSAVNAGVTDQWKIGAGEIAIVTDSAVEWCRNTADTNTVSVNTDLAGGSTAGSTYYGFAVDDGDGTYSALTKTTSEELDGQRLVCTIEMENTGDPPAIESILNYTYNYHASVTDTSVFPQAVKTLNNAGAATTVSNVKVVTGWGWVDETGAESYYTEDVDISNSGITTVYSFNPAYCGFVATGVTPDSWQDFTAISGNAAHNEPKVAWGYYTKTENEEYTFWVGASDDVNLVPANENSLTDGKYGFTYTVMGE